MHQYREDIGQHFYRCEQVINGAAVENSEFLILIYDDGRFSMEMLNSADQPSPMKPITQGGRAVWTMELFCYVTIDANTGEIADVRFWRGTIS